MRIPWGFATLIAGLVLVYGVEGYDTLGWILVGVGVFTQIVMFILLAVFAAAVKSVSKKGSW